MVGSWLRKRNKGEREREKDDEHSIAFFSWPLSPLLVLFRPPLSLSFRLFSITASSRNEREHPPPPPPALLTLASPTQKKTEKNKKNARRASRAAPLEAQPWGDKSSRPFLSREQEYVAALKAALGIWQQMRSGELSYDDAVLARKLVNLPSGFELHIGVRSFFSVGFRGTKS